jgi:hypothetical protein
MTLAWPLGGLSTCLTICKRHNWGLRRFADMYWLALRDNIPPVEYALYRFYLPERSRERRCYLYWTDLPALGICTARRGANNADVQNKQRFASLCAQAGFPHAPTLAVFAGGRQSFPEGPFTPEVPALWVKALELKGGAGAMKWQRTGQSAGQCYENSNGERCTPGQLADRLRRENCIVQPCLENHPSLSQLTNGALNSLRIVTGMTARNDAAFITAMMTLAHGEKRTSVAGIMASIDESSGQIRHAALPGGVALDHHPDTGAQIAGAVLPFWQESRALVLRAHEQSFARFAFLGWDVALTPEGPILLETNSGWGAIFHQMLDGPIGKTAFGDLVQQYL